MKKLFKILLSSGLMTGMSSIVFATETALVEATPAKEGMSLKPVFFIVLVLVIIGILYLSFKLDTPSSGKTKKKTKKSVNEQKVTNNLVEKDVTYEAEAKETYVDENIAHVKVDEDEDEVSLFESYSNPDTLPEEEVVEDEDDVLGKLDALDEDEDFSEKEESSSLDSFVETPAEEPEETNYDLNSDSGLDGDGDETNDFTSGEEFDGEGDNALDSYDLNNNGIDDTEETMEDNDSFSETMVFDSYDLNSEEKTEEDETDEPEEVEEEVEEEEEEENNYSIPKPEDDDDFGGFTTIKRNSVPSPEFSAKRATSTPKEEKKEVKKETKPAVEEKEPEVDSASMFLKQMEANLSGVEPAPKNAAAKKTATKKAAPAKKETKTATKKTTTKAASTKKTATAKKTTTKKTTKK